VDALPAAITDHLAEIRDLCVKYHVKRLAVFGSAAKGTFDPAKSDVDFVVEFDPRIRGAEGWDVYWNFRYALRDLLSRAVDLVEFRAVRNPYFREILVSTQRELYAAA
jgi:predicted nucleotidyltransferase